MVYVLRAVGDVAHEAGPGWPTWLSPIGWGQQFRPYAGDRWWVLLITTGFAAVMIAFAYVLVATRDLGTGLIPERPGPAAAAAWLRSPPALAWRLQRATLAAWIGGFALPGLAFGSIASSVEGFFGSAQARELFATLGGAPGLVDAYFAATLGFIAIGASAYGVQAAARLRGEEAGARAELLLSTGTSRARWVLGHAVVALAGTAALLLVAGGAAGLAQSLRTGDPASLGRLLGAAAVQVPAAWVVVGIAVAGFGLASRAATAGWVALAGFIVLAELGPLLRLGQRLLDLSPYTHSPRLPGGVIQVAPLIWLSLVAVALLIVGVSAIRRRDLR